MARQSGSTTSGGKGIASRVPVVVSATAPLPRKGLLWLDTSVSATAIGIRSITTLTAAETLDTTHDVVLCDASSGAFTVTLPAAATLVGKQYDIKKIDSSSNVVTVDANGSETIDGSLTILIPAQYSDITIVTDGTNWHILAVSS